MAYIVELKNIRKEFPGVVALEGVNLSLKSGSVHGIVGENGAGKSTLMKILSGTYSSYEGQLFFQGKEVHLRNESDALSLGISIVPQELNPVPELSIAENVFLGREQQKIRGIFNRKTCLSETSVLMSRLGLNYDPATKMRNLSIAQKQMVEIIKAISRNSKVIIMDEPTSALTSIETKHLFTQIQSLKQQNIAIVFISHKLEEVFAVCDEVSILRDGHLIATDRIDALTRDQMIKLMVGREMKDIYPDLPDVKPEIVLQVEGLTSEGIYNDISFKVHKGEILGFAGMMGAGRSEIMRGIFGLDPVDRGTVKLNGKILRIHSIHDIIKSGIAMVTEDRAAYGFVAIRSIKDNISLPNADMFSAHGIIQNEALIKAVNDICSRLDVHAPGPETLVGTLSGGNQQKVVLSKWLVRNVKVLIMDEPTRGIDVGAKQEIYRLITELAAQGVAIILISSEMPEVLALSHRIMIVSEGRIVGELVHNEATQDKIMKIIVKGRTEE